MSQYIYLLSIVLLMTSTLTSEQLQCSTSCECILGGQEIICDGSKQDPNQHIQSLNHMPSIDTLILNNFKITTINEILQIPVNHLVIKNSSINLLSIVMNGNHKLNRLSLNNMEITKAWDWGLMFSRLSELKDFRLEDSSLPSKELNIYIGQPFNSDNMLSVSMISCQIESIVGNVFNNWSNLRMISLANNSISELNNTWFPSQLHNLWSLDLSHNIIKSIPPNFFGGMPLLKKLRLDNNSFNTLRANWFDPIWQFNGSNLGLHELWINDNPIQCNPDLLWIPNVKHPIFFGDGHCYSNLTNKTRNLHTLRQGDEEILPILP